MVNEGVRPLISIIIPVYNTEKYLERLLLSIEQQSFHAYEVLLIDDGSTDQSAVICQNWENLDVRFHYYYQENAGVSAARNMGMKQAEGEYITFLDSDDVIDSNYLEELLNVCGDADIAVCDVVCETQKHEELKRFSLEKQELSSQETLTYLLTREGINSGPCAKLYRKKIIEHISFPNLKAYEDILFVVQAVQNSEKIAITNETAYHYIYNSESAMHSFVKNPSTDIIVATEWLVDFWKKNKGLKEECLYISLSHLYQYVIPIIDSPNEFVRNTRRIFQKYWMDILKNKAFPWKEKIVYGLFSLGWNYKDKKLSRIRG